MKEGNRLKESRKEGSTGEPGCVLEPANAPRKAGRSCGRMFSVSVVVEQGASDKAQHRASGEEVGETL